MRKLQASALDAFLLKGDQNELGVAVAGVFRVFACKRIPEAFASILKNIS